MAGTTATGERKRAVSALKRGLILEAAERVFEAEGLEGASLRAIAKEAGYTPAALYFHFESKEALYAAVLAQSLAVLNAEIAAAVAAADPPGDRLRAAALGFFDYYAARPRDLAMGFYLFRGGLKPHGLGRERDKALNAELERSLRPIAVAAESLGAPEEEARLLMLDCFAHASGILLLLHTRRLGMKPAAARQLFARRLDEALGRLSAAAPRRT